MYPTPNSVKQLRLGEYKGPCEFCGEPLYSSGEPNIIEEFETTRLLGVACGKCHKQLEPKRIEYIPKSQR